MGRVTCKDLKMILTLAGYDGKSWVRRIYKGHNAFTGKAVTRLDLGKMKESERESVLKLLRGSGLELRQDDTVHWKDDYIVE
jgi:hypothetical protein